MYCPQCGNESSSGQQFCRNCGANLKVIGKAVALSEAIGRSDRGPLPKIKEMVKGFKIEHVTEEVEKALDKMNSELVRISPPKNTEHYHQPWINFRRKKTPEERREQHISKGLVSMFSGAGLTVFLYYLSAALILKLPPNVVAGIPFEVDPVVRIIWLIGLIPMLSGMGNVISGLLIRPSRTPALQETESRPPEIEEHAQPPIMPHSVTDRTTELLKRDRFETGSGSDRVQPLN